MCNEVTMNSMSLRRVESKADRAHMHRNELIACIARAVPTDGTIEPLKGLFLQRTSSTSELIYGMTDTAFCVIAQGSKEIWLGDDRYQYDPAHYLLTTAQLPVVGKIVKASPAQPYLSLRVELNLTLVGSVMAETGHVPSRRHTDVRAINVSPLDASLLGATVRLVRLLDEPSEAQFLMPMLTREIIYRLLRGAQSNRLCEIATQGGQTHRIVKAIERFREGFDQTLRIDDIAQELGMSVSGFHHHFKAVTGMSPLQFQKRQRLQHARLLMLNEHLDVTNTAYRVGYDDASHFTREYKKLFGAPPLRDVERLRQASRQNAGLDTI